MKQLDEHLTSMIDDKLGVKVSWINHNSFYVTSHYLQEGLHVIVRRLFK